jgi:hypothetical protein
VPDRAASAVDQLSTINSQLAVLFCCLYVARIVNRNGHRCDVNGADRAPRSQLIKSGTDVTSAAYTIKGVLDTARAYAKANNTAAHHAYDSTDGCEHMAAPHM